MKEFSPSEIKKELKNLGRPESLKHMAGFGINVNNAFGVSIPDLRKLGKKIGKNHDLALELWETGIHENRILASMVDDRKRVTKVQMNRWVKDFNSWDLCDQCCNNLFVYTVYATERAMVWHKSKLEFVKRAGFVLMAVQAVHDNTLGNEQFRTYLKLIKEHSTDERNYVKKALNWALRQIGKRDWELNKLALKTSEEILKIDSPGAKWIARDAIRELKSETAARRIKASMKKR